jgi:hypothetical protein
VEEYRYSPYMPSWPWTGKTLLLTFGRRICKYNIQMDFNTNNENELDSLG